MIWRETWELLAVAALGEVHSFSSQSTVWSWTNQRCRKRHILKPMDRHTSHGQTHFRADTEAVLTWWPGICRWMLPGLEGTVETRVGTPLPVGPCPAPSTTRTLQSSQSCYELLSCLTLQQGVLNPWGRASLEPTGVIVFTVYADSFSVLPSPKLFFFIKFLYHFLVFYFINICFYFHYFLLF